MKKKKDTFSCKRAEKKDINIFFEWANDPEVRKSAFKTNKISWSEHKNWYYKKIQSKKVPGKSSNILPKNLQNCIKNNLKRPQNLPKIPKSLSKKIPVPKIWTKIRYVFHTIL